MQQHFDLLKHVFERSNEVNVDFWNANNPKNHLPKKPILLSPVPSISVQPREKNQKKTSTRLCNGSPRPKPYLPSCHDLFWFVQAWAMTLKSTKQKHVKPRHPAPLLFDFWEENILHPNWLAHSLPQDMSLVNERSCWWLCCIVVSYEAPCNPSEINYHFTSPGLQKPTSFRC